MRPPLHLLPNGMLRQCVVGGCRDDTVQLGRLGYEDFPCCAMHENTGHKLSDQERDNVRAALARPGETYATIALRANVRESEIRRVVDGDGRVQFSSRARQIAHVAEASIAPPKQAARKRWLRGR